VSARRRFRRIVAISISLVLFGLTGCKTSGHSNADAATTPSTTTTTIDSAPMTNAPAWCVTLDDPAVVALPDVLPRLLTDDSSAMAPKVHAAAAVLRSAATSAPGEPMKLLTDTADSLETAADHPSADSLQAVATAFASLSEGVQSACGFH
jgi:hypothetical protein